MIKKYLFDYMNTYVDMAPEKLEAFIESLPIKAFKKGSMILYQGQQSEYCVFVIEGCLRQYRVDEDGKEVTSEFYEEGYWINVFNESKDDPVSRYSIICSEDALLIYSHKNRIEEETSLFPELSHMTANMLEEKIGEMNESIYSFSAKSPQDRVETLLNERPGLFKRVPHHQIASYLGLTPESLSRIKKRLNHWLKSMRKLINFYIINS